MKILHVNCSERGSTGKIIADISKYASGEGHESYLCAPAVSGQSEYLEKRAVCVRHEQGLYKRISWVLGLQYGFSPLPTMKILKAIREIRPDIVHLHSINCSMVNIYKLLDFLKKNKIPTVVTNHAEFLYTGSCSYAQECEKWKTGCGKCPRLRDAAESRLFDRTATAWKKMKKAFEGFEKICITSVSPWVTGRASESPIMEGLEQRTVLNGLNTDIFTLRDGGAIRQKHGLTENDKMIVCVTSSFDPMRKNDIKGSAYLVELARELKAHNVKVFVIGTYHLPDYELPENMVFVGPVYDQEELSAYYSAADLSVITSKRETFSMPVSESLCCGTPVVGFCAGGPESIAIPEFSAFVEQGSVDKLKEVILSEWLDKKRILGKEKISETARVRYSSEEMAKNYLLIYKGLI